jgi:hypothetical protein
MSEARGRSPESRGGTMRAGGERGEGKLGLAFFALVAYSIFHVAPVYYDHYNLVDKMTEMARAPKWSHNDDKIYDTLIKYTRQEGMDRYVKRNNFTVQTIEGSRRISVDYERTAEILPGWKHLFKFSKMIEQPLI